jgi:hypothetical protein
VSLTLAPHSRIFNMTLEPVMESSFDLSLLVTVSQDSPVTRLCPWSDEGRNYSYTFVFSNDITVGQSPETE